MSMTPTQLDVVKKAMMFLEAKEAMNDLTVAEFFEAIKEAALWRLRRKDDE
jgi:hypothetical protein